MNKLNVVFFIIIIVLFIWNEYNSNQNYNLLNNAFEKNTREYNYKQDQLIKKDSLLLIGLVEINHQLDSIRLASNGLLLELKDSEKEVKRVLTKLNEYNKNIKAVNYSDSTTTSLINRLNSRYKR